MKTFKIHLVRCGLTEANLQGRYLGREDVPVCEQGLEQLRYLKEKFSYPRVQAVFTSPLQRCKQTAAMLFEGAPMIEIPNFTEYDFGEFEGFTAEELKDNEAFIAWMGDNGDAAPPFGESNNHFKARVAIDFEKQDGERLDADDGGARRGADVDFILLRFAGSTHARLAV